MVSNFDLNRTALNNQMMGLSTDTKPTTGILPNSLFWELDTNGMYYFDGTQWQSIGGSGGGGGGSSDFSTAQVTIVNPPILVKLPVLVNNTETNMTGIACEYALKEDENTITVALYKGHCYYISTTVQDVSGNIQYNETLQLYDITGDCTITFPGMG